MGREGTEMDRRAFLSGIAILPAALALSPIDLLHSSVYDLPIHSDLSIGSFCWALEHGKQMKLGNPLELVTGAENWDIIRRMIGRIPAEYLHSYSDIAITCTGKDENREWSVLFEHGRVRSQGPN